MMVASICKGDLIDVGSDIYYKGSERNLAPFLKAHRDRVWVVSKAPAVVYAEPDDTVSVE